MGKALKKIIIVLSFSAIGFIAFKIYKFLREVIELEKMLPQYLKTQFGEKPEISLTVNFKGTILKVKFSKSTLEMREKIEQSILEFVGNYYSCLNIKKLKVDLVEKKAASADENEKKLKDSIQKAEQKIESLLNNNQDKKPTRRPRRKPAKKKAEEVESVPEKNEQPKKKRTTRRRKPKAKTTSEITSKETR